MVIKQITRGCPQGSSSGPLLWIILYNGLLHIQDKAHSNLKAKIIGFADDTLILMNHRNQEVLQSRMNSLLDNIQDWTVKNKLIINTNKCACIVFPRKKPLNKKPSIKIRNERIRCTDIIKYLGIQVDSQLTWSPHMDYVKQKAVTMSHALRSISRNLWGLSHKSSSLIYHCAIEPAVLYGAEVWGYATRRQQISKKLQTIQRCCLITVCRAYRTAPTSGLQVIANTVPLDLKAAGRYWLFQLKHFPSHLVTCNTTPPRIKTIAENILKNGIDKYNDYSLVHPATVPPVVDINSGIREKTCTTIYTDGSKGPMGVGAAFVHLNNNSRVIHQAYFKLSPFCTINQAESLAISNALKYVQRTVKQGAKEKIALVSDSKVALHQIQALNTNLKLIKDITLMTNLLEKKNINISFHWTKGHSGVLGNDKADFLAKKAICNIAEPTFSFVPLSWVKAQLHEFTISRWQERWATGSTGRSTFDFFPTIEERNKANHYTPDFHTTQFITGHGGFKHYLKRFLNKGNGMCDCKKGKETPEHILFHCPVYSTHRVQLKSVMYSQGFHWPCQNKDFLFNKKTTTAFKTFIYNTGITSPNFHPSTNQRSSRRPSSDPAT
ncbi:uncharacterized protein [Centruroides vittatus]|uniref:uncharacterized protein n=1 Tax=Centruroides vittatus TaxID=120091 RepID=UPI00351062A4